MSKFLNSKSIKSLVMSSRSSRTVLGGDKGLWNDNLPDNFGEFTEFSFLLLKRQGRQVKM